MVHWPTQTAPPCRIISIMSDDKAPCHPLPARTSVRFCASDSDAANGRIVFLFKTPAGQCPNTTVHEWQFAFSVAAASGAGADDLPAPLSTYHVCVRIVNVLTRPGVTEILAADYTRGQNAPVEVHSAVLPQLQDLSEPVLRITHGGRPLAGLLKHRDSVRLARAVAVRRRSRAAQGHKEILLLPDVEYRAELHLRSVGERITRARASAVPGQRERGSVREITSPTHAKATPRAGTHWRFSTPASTHCVGLADTGSWRPTRPPASWLSALHPPARTEEMTKRRTEPPLRRPRSTSPRHPMARASLARRALPLRRVRRLATRCDRYFTAALPRYPTALTPRTLQQNYRIFEFRMGEPVLACAGVLPSATHFRLANRLRVAIASLPAAGGRQPWWPATVGGYNEKTNKACRQWPVVSDAVHAPAADYRPLARRQSVERGRSRPDPPLREAQRRGPSHPH